jgi:zinc transporter, ZIP family
MSEFIILAIPFLGTSLGSAMVFFLKKRIAPKFEKLLLGFAAGVMIAASVWSLLIPSIDMCKGNNSPEWLAALVGFLAGIFFLLLLDTVIPHMHIESKNQEGINTAHISKTTMMLFAVTLHNIPEGMSVGVAFAGAMMKDSGITAAAAMALAIGIAIQNFPEGAIISMPLRGEGMSKKKAFVCGVLSGIVEPVGGFITILIAGVIAPVLPYLLSFAAGAMMYVVIEELIPESQSSKHSNIGTIGAAIGFALMMVLDIALG